MLALIKEISLRHLVSSPVRSFLVVLGIARGVAVLIATQATSRSMLKSFDELVERVSGRADLMLAGNESGIDSALVAKVAQIKGVAHAASALEITTRFADDKQTLLVLGVDFLGDTHFLPFQAHQPYHRAQIIADKGFCLAQLLRQGAANFLLDKFIRNTDSWKACRHDVSTREPLPGMLTE